MDFERIPFPAERKLVVDSGYLGSNRHIYYIALDVDVTDARLRLQDLSERLGRKISFTAFLTANFAQAIAARPQVQAYQDWLGRLVIFHEVDVVTLIEPEAGRVAIPHIIRAADRRSVVAISDEIRSVQARPAQSEQRGGLVALGPRLPRFVRMFFYWVIKKNPFWFKRISGTALVTAVGMFGKSGGWGITFLPLHTLGLTVGGIAQKPGVAAGAIAIREYLSLTLSFDHDVVDGAPAVRFAGDFVSRLERAAGLDDFPAGS